MAAPAVIARWQNALIAQRLSERRILLLTGARQCGKSTLAQNLVGASYEYRTLDNPNMLATAQSDPLSFLQHKSDTLIIDEIQRTPDLLPVIKLAVDEDPRPGRFILTGSANLSAIPQARESLAGRVAPIRLRPFTQGELHDASPSFLKNAFAQSFSTQMPTVSRAEIIELAFCGGYPEVQTLRDAARQSWHRDYIAAILDRDLAEISRIRRRSAMHKLVEITAAWSSKYMSVADIGAGLAIKRPTLESYLNTLEALYLIDRVPAWNKTDYDRVGKQDKLFMTDSGLMASLLNWDASGVTFDGKKVGKLIETFVYSHLAAECDCDEQYHLYHYRDRSRHEIDFLVERGDSIVGIEVKAAATVAESDFKHLRWFLGNLSAGRPFTGIVLYAGDEVLSFGQQMLAVPLSTLWQA